MRTAGDDLGDLAGRCGDVAVPVEGAFVLEVRVEPDHVHHLVIEPDGYRYAAGTAADPDAWLTIGVELAQALRAGTVPVATAVQSGGLRLGGDLGALLQHQEALRAVVEHAAGISTDEGGR